MNKIAEYFSLEEDQFLLDRISEGATYQAVADELNYKFGKSRTRDSIRGRYRKIKDANFSHDATAQYLKDKLRTTNNISKIAKENRAVLNNSLFYEDFLEELKEINKKIKANFVKPKKSVKKSPGKRVIVGHISDTHIGINISKKEVAGKNEFNPTITTRRFAYLFDQIRNYKPQYRKETDLVLVLNGDLLAGIIHDQENGILPMTTQYSIALRIFSEGISLLASDFNKVNIICTVGNHGRFMHKSNKSRQTMFKWDSFDTMFHLTLKELFKSYKNVSFQIDESPYSFFKIFNHNFMATHGDTVIKLGNVGRSINVERLTNELNKISTSFNHKVDVLMCGHLHKITYQTLDNGSELLVNGCLSGIDPFAQAIGIFTSEPAQQLFEVTKEHSVGDIRFIRLSKADNDSSLDKIIQPQLDLF